MATYEWSWEDGTSVTGTRIAESAIGSQLLWSPRKVDLASQLPQPLASIGSDCGAGFDFLLSPLNTLEEIGCEVVIFQVIEAVLDHFADVESFCSPGVVHQKIEPLFGFCGESDLNIHFD
jgi:hypothetical protein